MKNLALPLLSFDILLVICMDVRCLPGYGPWSAERHSLNTL